MSQAKKHNKVIEESNIDTKISFMKKKFTNSKHLMGTTKFFRKLTLFIIYAGLLMKIVYSTPDGNTTLQLPATTYTQKNVDQNNHKESCVYCFVNSTENHFKPYIQIGVATATENWPKTPKTTTTEQKCLYLFNFQKKETEVRGQALDDKWYVIEYKSDKNKPVNIIMEPKLMQLPGLYKVDQTIKDESQYGNSTAPNTEKREYQNQKDYIQGELIYFTEFEYTTNNTDPNNEFYEVYGKTEFKNKYLIKKCTIAATGSKWKDVKVSPRMTSIGTPKVLPVVRKNENAMELLNTQFKLVLTLEDKKSNVDTKLRTEQANYSALVRQNNTNLQTISNNNNNQNNLNNQKATEKEKLFEKIIWALSFVIVCLISTLLCLLYCKTNEKVPKARNCSEDYSIDHQKYYTPIEVRSEEYAQEEKKKRKKKKKEKATKAVDLSESLDDEEQETEAEEEIKTEEEKEAEEETEAEESEESQTLSSKKRRRRRRKKNRD